MIASITPPSTAQGASETTTYSYSPDYQGALLTSVTNALGQSKSYTYTPQTSLLQTATDANGNVTTYNYYPDTRLQSIVYPPNPAGAQPETDYAYPTPNEVDKSQKENASATIQQQTLYDGLGRLATTKFLGGCSSNDSIATETTYDLNGRLYSTTSPHCSAAASSTDGTTYHQYDALSRPLLLIEPDGSTQSWSYNDDTTTFTDESGSSWSRTNDALGRTTNVIEPSSLQTTYSYDGFDNLKSVNQVGMPGETSRARSFSYDSLSRLTSSTNPETGTIQYTSYDGNGNLLSKTDARGVISSYTYDALNRITSKSYSDGTLSTEYDYDTPGEWDGLPSTNVIGRLKHIAVGRGTPYWDERIYSYDTMGRVNLIEDAPPSEAGVTDHVISAQYDLAGNMTDLWYPRALGTTGPHVQQSFDAAGRLSKVFTMDTGAETDYWTANSFFPDGTPKSVTYGNGVTEQRAENSRLQTCELSAFLSPTIGGSMVMDHQYFFSPAGGSSPCAPAAGNNGNIWQIVDNTNPTAGSNARNQTFGYDGLNRLTSWNTSLMSGSPRSQSYAYDSFGNMAQTAGINMPNFPVGYGGTGTPWAFDSTNHLLSNYFNCSPANSIGINPANPGYDLAGNMLCQGVNGIDAQASLHDAENRVSQVQSQSFSSTYATSATYTYDAEGTRVRKDLAPFNNQNFTEYTYFNGQPISEKDQNGNWTDYIYANGAKIAKANPLDAPLHISGDNCYSCGGTASYVNLSSGAGYVIQTGDALNLTQYNAGDSVGGLILRFADGTQTSGLVAQDQNGQQINCDAVANQLHNRHIDLSAYAGETLASTLVIDDVCSPGGHFDLYLNDIAIVGGSGQVTTIYSPQLGATYAMVDATAAWPGPVANMRAVSEPNTYVPAGATHYYIGDHLGTTQMEFASGGWPLWQGSFAPFGQEVLPGVAMDFVGPLPADGTAMHYKFTGKERDTESGLDYFGARYYASNMGRFISPDWSAKAEPVPYSKLDNPQSLNLYSYVLNNPLSNIDDDGHDIIFAANLKNAQVVKDTVQAMLANPNTSGSLSGYVGPGSPNLTIQSGDLGPPTVEILPNGQTLTTTVLGNTAPDIQSGNEVHDGVESNVTKLTGATITIDNSVGANGVAPVMVHEGVHAGDAKANPAQFNKDAKAEKSLPHDQRPQEQRAIAADKAYSKQIAKEAKQIAKDRKKDPQ